MKFLSCILLSCLALLGSAQIYPVAGSPLDLTAVNSIPAGKVEARGTDFYVGTKPVFFFIATLSDNAVVCDANRIALIRRMGNNSLRLHHIDRAIWEGWITVDQIVATMDAAHALGMRVFIDGTSKMGEIWPSGFDGWKVDVIRGEPTARSRYLAYLDKIKPILSHPSMVGLNLINEGATYIKAGVTIPGTAVAVSTQATPTEALNSFWDWAIPEVRARGFAGLITDIPDGFVEVPIFAPAVRRLNYATLHFYGAHPYGDRYYTDSWVFEDWISGLPIWYGQTSQLPVISQEDGSLPFNPKRGSNTFFWIGQHLANGWDGSASYSLFSNAGQAQGNHPTVDMFAVYSDLQRTVAEKLKAFAFAYGRVPTIEHVWGRNDQRSERYLYRNAKVSISVDGEKGKAIVNKTATKAFLFLTDRTEIRGFESVQDGGTRRITALGGNQQTSYSPGWVQVSDTKRVTSAYQLHPWTGSRIATLPVSGGMVLPVNGCGVVECNLR